VLISELLFSCCSFGISPRALSSSNQCCALAWDWDQARRACRRQPLSFLWRTGRSCCPAVSPAGSRGGGWGA